MPNSRDGAGTIPGYGDSQISKGGAESPMTVDQVVALCFEAYLVPGCWSCRRCGALVPVDRSELHLSYHHPDLRVPEGDGVAIIRAGWKHGVPPNWARPV